MQSKPASTPKRGLVAIIGASAAAALYMLVPQQEGYKPTTYKDPVGILTYCTGATENAVWGKTYTTEECRAQLDKDLSEAAEGVMACIKVPLNVGQRVAYVDAAYNIGVGAFCGSSMARATNAGHDASGCDALVMWNKAGGKVLPGLTKRRAIEREYCLGTRKP